MLKRILVPSLIALIVLLSFVVGMVYSNTPKMAFINLQKLYDQFELKKEMEKKLTTVQTARKNTLDSLEFRLNALSDSMKYADSKEQQKIRQQFEMQRKEYLYKDKSYTEDNENMVAQYDEQVWGQLNQYITEFGEKNNYTMVLGGDGSGSVMYAQSSLDITEKVASYVNERYKGK